MTYEANPLRIHWKIFHYNLIEQEAIHSDDFYYNFNGEDLQWRLVFEPKSNLGNDVLPDVIEEECDEKIIDADSKSNKGYCSLYLQLDDETSDELSEATRDAIIKYRFYLCKEKGKKEVLFHRGSKYVKSFGTWGKKISLDLLLDEANKYFVDECFKFAVIITIHPRIKDDVSPKLDEDLFNNNLYSDFKVICTDNEIPCEIPVHRSVLHRHSEVFAAMFQSDMAETKENQVTIDDIEGSVVLEMLRFIYTGKVEKLREYSFDLLYAAEKYGINDLKTKCIDSITIQLNIKNVFDALVLADRFNEEILMSNCLKLIVKEKYKLLDIDELSKGDSKIDMKLFLKCIDIVTKEPFPSEFCYPDYDFVTDPKDEEEEHDSDNDHW